MTLKLYLRSSPANTTYLRKQTAKLALPVRLCLNVTKITYAVTMGIGE